jgi:5-methylthioadenosine/S-adenosylhomocysteine deaminase
VATKTFTADWVVPIDSPPIERGEVVVDGARIVDVRARGGPAAADALDLGRAALLPGFVNAHTHLEYTALRGFLEDVPFFPWIRALTEAKAGLDKDGWVASARLGVLESIASGTTTFGDNTDAGVVAQILDETGLRGIVYQEFFGIDDREPVGPILGSLRAKLAASEAFAGERVRLGISPHALYTIRPALFDALDAASDLRELPRSMHVAESAAESRLLWEGTGPFAEMYARRGIHWETPRCSPTSAAVNQRALNAQSLAVHCVHQCEDDVARVAASGAAVVHCPKSNGKLGAGIAPLAQWLRTPGLRIALGTDSAVSNNTLDLFEEMRHALLTARAAGGAVDIVSAGDVLRMATLGGAEALGVTETGSLTPGKRADLIAVRLDRAHTTPFTDPVAALVYSARADDVVLTVCDGRVLYRDGEWRTVDAAAVTAAARTLRAAIPSPAGVGQ